MMMTRSNSPSNYVVRSSDGSNIFTDLKISHVEQVDVFIVFIIIIIIITIILKISHVEQVDILNALFLSSSLVAIITIIIIIIIRPKPAYDQQGLVGSWSQDTDEVRTFLVFLTSHFAPAALSSDLKKKPWKPTKNHEKP